MEDSISILIKVVNNNFARIMNNDIADIGLTSAQCNVLGFIYASEKDEINPRDIEKSCYLKKPTVTGILKRLVENGFIQLVPSHKDNRYKQIILTQKAFEHKEEMNKKFLAVEEILCNGISAEEKEMVIAILKKMFDNLKSYK